MRSAEVSNQEDLFVSDKLLEDIVWLEVTMYDFIFVNEVEWDANHCENSENIFFWDKLCFCITLDNVLEALIAFFHDNTRKIMLILDDINDFANHWVFKRP